VKDQPIRLRERGNFWLGGICSIGGKDYLDETICAYIRSYFFDKGKPGLGDEDGKTITVLSNISLDINTFPDIRRYAHLSAVTASPEQADEPAVSPLRPQAALVFATLEVHGDSLWTRQDKVMPAFNGSVRLN
jgi:hypothetical protein